MQMHYSYLYTYLCTYLYTKFLWIYTSKIQAQVIDIEISFERVIAY